MELFKPRAATFKNYKQREIDFYVSLVTLQRTMIYNKKEYVINSNAKEYRKSFRLSYSLVKFYTKHREEKKEYAFKRNYLLSKTRGIFSEQDYKRKKLADDFIIKKDQFDNLVEDYLRMFKIEKTYIDIKLKEEEAKAKKTSKN